jgi:hypothetical protein
MPCREPRPTRVCGSSEETVQGRIPYGSMHIGAADGTLGGGAISVSGRASCARTDDRSVGDSRCSGCGEPSLGC